MKIYGGKYLDENALKELGIGRVGRNVLVHEHTNLVGLENIELGSNVRIDPYVVISASGSEKVQIGNYVHIAPGCSLVGTHGIEMEDMTTISHGVRVFTVSDDYSGHTMTNPTVPDEYKNSDRGKVAIRRHVIVGSSTVILPGSELGEGAAVGALSLVNRSVEPWGVYAGIPVRRLRAREKHILEFERRLRTELGAGD